MRQKEQNKQDQKKNKQDQKNNKGQQKPDKKEQKKQDAERMLEAVKNNERQTLKEQTKKVQASEFHSEKDW